MSYTPEKVYDIIISGAGVPGTSLALAAIQQGLSVALVDRRLKLGEGIDTRTTAFLPESLQFFDTLEILNCVREHSQPLMAMRLINDQSSARDNPEPLTFNGHKGAPLALNLPNQHLLEALDKELTGKVEFYGGQTITNAEINGDWARISLSDDSVLAAKLCVVAEGRNSHTRELLGIKWQSLSQSQTALTARLQHTHNHEGISTEFHRTAGPMTFVPLPGDGHRSALVWCQRNSSAEQLESLNETAFLRRIQMSSRGVLGDIVSVESRASFPVRPGLANQFSRGPFVVIAEAAHVLPPLLAQGLHLSISDVIALISIIAKHGPGHKAAEEYSKVRWGDAVSRLGISEGLNQLLQHSPLNFSALYTWGHRALSRNSSARDIAVKIGQRGHQRVPA